MILDETKWKANKNQSTGISRVNAFHLNTTPNVQLFVLVQKQKLLDYCGQ